jgi:hypothetical protein
MVRGVREDDLGHAVRFINFCILLKVITCPYGYLRLLLS